ncbi:MAG: hypothetical protein CMB80_11165 [Flammeovirgaceae bacterium]|nr:hypothetical protein [Flammeovirgaceae bacterium]|tara:strand:- start:2682 stop:3089 length:408 start_codon:yes stop_codon:yes gene_type:complete
MNLSRSAEFLLVAIFSLLIIFHVLIITSITPYDIVWGSRLSSSQEMIVFELISLALNVFFLSVILMHAQIIRPILSTKVLKILIWVMMGLFILNTLGNLVSENDFEKLAFTPVTILLSIALYIVAKSKKGMSSLN